MLLARFFLCYVLQTLFAFLCIMSMFSMKGAESHLISSSWVTRHSCRPLQLLYFLCYVEDLCPAGV
ncbi:hypothetical protein SLEP1_g22880 [Rubroshorea leprosula]|uniref:Secreted protein n=1 Tax=Rubroshorea leprosula TaxID=152421 RepID=A0AAV5JLH3_9ROSI|nr:hypothetical protein SLEP1_g22880 [Rubroshorea leprosula]